jgi:ketosteroid isomerase-like protein
MTLEPADSLEILQLVARVDACASARDAMGYVALFTDDAVMDGDMGQANAQELSETISRVWAAEPPGTLHLTLNAVIEESGPQPTVASTLLLLTPASSSPMLGSASVRQTVRKTPAGWRVAARTISTQPSLE